MAIVTRPLRDITAISAPGATSPAAKALAEVEIRTAEDGIRGAETTRRALMTRVQLREPQRIDRQSRAHRRPTPLRLKTLNPEQ